MGKCYEQLFFFILHLWRQSQKQIPKYTKKISTRQTTIKVIDPDFANSTKFNNYLHLKNWMLKQTWQQENAT